MAQTLLIELLIDLWDAQGMVCFYCQEEKTKNTKDHFIPAALCSFVGKRTHVNWHLRRGNIVLACRACNRRKSDRMPSANEIARYEAIFKRPAPTIELLRDSWGKEVIDCNLSTIWTGQ
jgi:5-methylcytosine-specific restriction endonuclease McrA